MFYLPLKLWQFLVLASLAVVKLAPAHVLKIMFSSKNCNFSFEMKIRTMFTDFRKLSNCQLIQFSQFQPNRNSQWIDWIGWINYFLTVVRRVTNSTADIHHFVQNVSCRHVSCWNIFNTNARPNCVENVNHSYEVWGVDVRSHFDHPFVIGRETPVVIAKIENSIKIKSNFGVDVNAIDFFFKFRYALVAIWQRKYC